MKDIIDKYIENLRKGMDNNPKLSMFGNDDPDFDKELVLKEARIIATENLKQFGSPNIEPRQFMDILKNIKKSNEILKLLEVNHAYITHIKEDGSLQYIFTNYGYKKLKNLGII